MTSSHLVLKGADKSYMGQYHPFHLVDFSPLPFVTSYAAFTCTIGGVLYFQGFQYGGSILVFGLCFLVYSMGIWWRDVIREATFQGLHTIRVQVGLRYGMILFIVSEVMFFFAFFWAFFHSSLSPSIEIGCVFPPYGIEVLDPWGIPFLNTLILLSSGATVTWAHHAILGDSPEQTRAGLACTIFLAIIFTAFQATEYYHTSFTISDSVYGSTFFLLTGFHGFHVFVGTLFLAVSLARVDQYSRLRHFGFEAAAWYWHFVDVVWLYLFVAIYWWGGV